MTMNLTNGLVRLLTTAWMVVPLVAAFAQDYVPLEERVSAAVTNSTTVVASGAATPASQGMVQPPASAEDDARINEIFAEYLAALGGEEALRRLESRVIHGRVESRGKTVDYESQQLADGRFALVQHFPKDAFRLAHDGINTWTQTGEEKWHNLPELDAQVERIDNHLLAPLRWREDFVNRRLLPMEMVNGRRAEVVEVTYPNGKVRKLFFDVKTHRLVRTDSMTLNAEGKPVTMQVLTDDFREVDGVTLPFTTETRMGGRTFVSTISSVVHNGPVDLNLINPPVGKTRGGGFRDSERFFEKLTIGELTYQNVWVHRQTNYNVLIRHAGGIQTIKLTSLPKADLDALRPQLGDLASIENEGRLAALNEKVKDMDLTSNAREIYQAQLDRATAMVGLLKVPLLVAFLLGNLVLSVFAVSLCRGTETRAGFGAWLPLFNLAALMRAAKMYGAWPLLGIVGYLLVAAAFGNQWVEPNSLGGLAIGGIGALAVLLAGFMWLVWCFKICTARKRSGWLGLLLLIPGVNLITVSYLAFSE